MRLELEHGTRDGHGGIAGQGGVQVFREAPAWSAHDDIRFTTSRLWPGRTRSAQPNSRDTPTCRGPPERNGDDGHQQAPGCSRSCASRSARHTSGRPGPARARSHPNFQRPQSACVEQQDAIAVSAAARECVINNPPAAFALIWVRRSPRICPALRGSRLPSAHPRAAGAGGGRARVQWRYVAPRPREFARVALREVRHADALEHRGGAARALRRVDAQQLERQGDVLFDAEIGST